MPRKESEINQLPSFVKLRTAPDMRKFAMLMAKIKRANDGIGKIRNLIRNSELTDADFAQLMKNLHDLANENFKSANEAIALLGGVQKKVDKYVRSL